VSNSNSFTAAVEDRSVLAAVAVPHGCPRLRGRVARVRVYIDTADWWIGLYRGPNHYYLCLLPCVVIRWERYRVSRLDIALAAALERGIKHDDAMERHGRP
jgi:hypothetical protein